MKIFISYASEQRDIADRLRGALVAEGDTVFQDREDIAVGEAFHKRIRIEIVHSDVFVFLATEESTAPGCYALSELKQAERVWPNPEGKVFVVLLDGLPPERLPGYLGSVSAHLPIGDAVADVLAELASIRDSRIGPGLAALRLLQGAGAGATALLLTFAMYESAYRELIDLINALLDVSDSTGSTPISMLFYRAGHPTLAVVSCMTGALVACRGARGIGRATLALITPLALIPVVYLAFASNAVRYNAGYDLWTYAVAVGVGVAAFMSTAELVTPRIRRNWRAAIRNNANAA